MPSRYSRLAESCGFVGGPSSRPGFTTGDYAHFDTADVTGTLERVGGPRRSRLSFFKPPARRCR
ncbi:hypothetical protein CUJ84_Chr003067 [Rhizobium leguminosarum]|uniref:Uncharacterized protein n=1 Tax=Rhizobium leguminosarum TaxID=384 RepID=A0A2K9Z5N1_RHILE|nr:hypothetical protein CUJ84_Chr003067 [Rhizobium leguminosarum]